ncbi:MAG: threonylcarbamoyl-AMP synthase [Rubrivivax sp.]|nr:threonylcarbamoyl-AMP synthase [Rubrivivax sp.]
MEILSGREPAAVRTAAARLAAGRLVAFPTETVYGLGARADDDAAVARIFAAKGRPADHPLIVHVAGRDAAAHFAAHWPASADRLARAFWPGPLTLIVPRRPGVAAAAAGGQDSIGLRLPAHPVALALLREAAALGVPGVAAPSANRFGRVSPTTAAHVRTEFEGLDASVEPVLTVLDGGACDVGIESAIVDCTRERPALLRPGQLSRARLEAVLGQPLAAPDAASPRASGTLASHYAPGVPVRLLAHDELRRRLQALAARPMAQGGQGDAPVGVYSRLDPGLSPGWLHRAMPGDAAAAAHELFAVLRELDAAGVAAIWVEQPPAGAAWDGVRDRLQRAAA